MNEGHVTNYLPTKFDALLEVDIPIVLIKRANSVSTVASPNVSNIKGSTVHCTLYTHTQSDKHLPTSSQIGVDPIGD